MVRRLVSWLDQQNQPRQQMGWLVCPHTQVDCALNVRVPYSPLSVPGPAYMCIHKALCKHPVISNHFHLHVGNSLAL